MVCKNDIFDHVVFHNIICWRKEIFELHCNMNILYSLYQNILVQISIPDDLYQWTETLAAQGHGSGTVLKLLTGPMWSGQDRKDVGKIELVCVENDLYGNQIFCLIHEFCMFLFHHSENDCILNFTTHKSTNTFQYSDTMCHFHRRRWMLLALHTRVFTAVNRSLLLFPNLSFRFSILFNHLNLSPACTHANIYTCVWITTRSTINNCQSLNYKYI